MNEKKYQNATVIIPCKTIEALTLNCINTILKLFPFCEIIVLPDINKIKFNFPKNVKVILTDVVSISKKRNVGSKKAKYDILAFIDSDAYPTKNWLTNALDTFNNEPNISALAGPNISPINEPWSEKYVGIVLKSNLCVINAHYVKIPNKKRIVNTMPSVNFFIKKAEFLEMGGMDETLWGSEDFELCNRLKKTNKILLYNPKIVVFHKNRNLKHFFLQRITYGAFAYDRIKSFEPKIILILLPAMLLLFLIAGLFFLNLEIFNTIYYSIILIVITVIAIETFRITTRAGDLLIVFLTLIAAVLSPALGTFAKLFNFLPNYQKIYRNDK